MARMKFKANNRKIEYECSISTFDEKQMKSTITVPYSWAKDHTNKKLKVKVEVVDDASQ